MGMYTEIYVNVSFKEDLPEEVLYAIKCMLGQVEEVDTDKLPQHDLFNTPRWKFMLRCSSYYHKPYNIYHFERDDISERYYLTSRSDFKNYDNESELFFDFIKPYVKDEFIGYTRYEEDDTPKLFYANSMVND